MARNDDAFSQLQAEAGGSGLSSGQAIGPRVYFGSAWTYDRSDRTTTKYQRDDTDSVEGGVMRWYQMSDEERSAIGMRLYRAGILKSATDYDGAFSAWKYAVQEAGNFYTASGGTKKITPWQFLSILEGNAAGKAGGGGPRTTTQTSRSVNLPSAADAEAAVKTIFQEAFGRDPNKGELSRYSSLLIGKAKANPSVSTTTQTVDANGNATSSTTSSGGISAAGLQQSLLDEAQRDPEYGAYQAATSYMSALMKSIAAPV